MCINEDMEALVNAKSLWKCLILLCLRGALSERRKAGKADRCGQTAGDPPAWAGRIFPRMRVPELLDPEVPQQLLVSAFRRYRR